MKTIRSEYAAQAAIIAGLNNPAIRKAQAKAVKTDTRNSQVSLAAIFAATVIATIPAIF